MTTANDVITRAAKTAKVLAAGETLSSEDATDILDALNEMLHGWELEGIALGHTDLALTDTVQLPDSHLRAIRFNLASEIAGEYGVPLNPLDLQRAQNGLTMLRSLYSKPRELGLPEDVRDLSHYARWNGIIRG